MAVTSCSDDLRDGGAPVTDSAYITVYASKGDAQTRSLLSEVDGNLTCAWTDGDQLLVTDVNGGKKGILKLINVNTGKFEGELIGVSEGNVTLKYFYLGTGVDLTNVSQSYIYDIAAQDGTIGSLSKNDALSTQAEIAVINGGAYPDGTLQLERHFSFAHFTLKLPEGVTVKGEPVTISGENILTKATLGLANRAVSDQTAGTITVNPGSNSFYVNLIPANDVAPVFTVTIDGKEYTGSLNARNIAAGKFLRKKDSGSNDSGVTVDMTIAGGDDPAKDDMVGPEFEINGKKYRFTSGNLYYNTKTGVWGIHERQTDFTNAGGLDLKDGSVEKTPELIGLFAWGATGLEDAQKPTTLREAAWQTTYGGHYFPSTAGQSKNSTIKTLWSNEYVYDWGRAYIESGRAADDDRQYLTPSTDIFTALMKGGFVQGATIKGAASDGSDVVGLIVIPGVKTLADAKTFINSVDGASCLSSMPDAIHNNSGNTFNYKNITLNSHDVLKKLNDAVFFPAADKRNLTSGTVYSSKDNGWYWSSTSNTTTNGYNLFFNGLTGGFAYNGSASNSSMGRFNQMAVRLLVEVK